MDTEAAASSLLIVDDEPFNVDLLEQELGEAGLHETFEKVRAFRAVAVDYVTNPLEAQAKLLRVLQEHEFERIGGSRSLGRPVETIAPAFVERASTCDWPGNIRELQNLVKRALIVSRSPVLDACELLAGPARRHRTRPHPPRAERLRLEGRRHRRRGPCARPEPEHPARAPAQTRPAPCMLTAASDFPRPSHSTEPRQAPGSLRSGHRKCLIFQDFPASQRQAHEMH